MPSLISTSLPADLHAPSTDWIVRRSHPNDAGRSGDRRVPQIHRLVAYSFGLRVFVAFLYSFYARSLQPVAIEV